MIKLEDKNDKSNKIMRIGCIMMDKEEIEKGVKIFQTHLEEIEKGVKFFQTHLENTRKEISELDSSYDDINKLIELNVLKNRVLRVATKTCDLLESLNRRLIETEIFSEELMRIVDELDVEIESIKNVNGWLKWRKM